MFEESVLEVVVAVIFNLPKSYRKEIAPHVQIDCREMVV